MIRSLVKLFRRPKITNSVRLSSSSGNKNDGNKNDGDKNGDNTKDELKGVQFTKLRTILETITVHQGTQKPQQQQQQQTRTQPLTEATKVTNQIEKQKIQQQKQQQQQQVKQQQVKPPITPQHPLPIPTRFDEPIEYQEIDNIDINIQKEEKEKEIEIEMQTQQKEIEMKIQIENKQKEEKQEKDATDGLKEQLKHSMQRAYDDDYDTPEKMRNLPVSPDHVASVSKKEDRSIGNQEEIDKIVSNIRSSHIVSIINDSIQFNDNISQWIYDFIQNNDNHLLPSPQDIIIEFPLLSIHQAYDIRDDVINELIDKLPVYLYNDGGNGVDRHKYDISRNINRFDNNNNINYNNSIGDHFSNYNPKETSCNRDPFDSFIHSKSIFNGIDEFDADFHQNGINLSGLNPSSAYGYNNKAYETYFDLHEPCIQEVESEYGKFRSLLTTSSNNLSHEMILDLSRKLHKISLNKRTIAIGLTSLSRKEYIQNMDINRILSAYNSGIYDIGTLYYSNLFRLNDDIIHLNKPLICGTSGILHNDTASLYLSSSCRLADSSTRILFDNCLYGSIPCGGFFYQMIVRNNGNINDKKILYHILSGDPISCWDLHEIGLIDWIMPSSNNVLLFNHLGNEIDKTFNSNFSSQDQFRHRSMLKSIIELYDRGIEYYRGNLTEDDCIHELREIFNTTSSSSISYSNNNLNENFLKIYENISQISSGNYDYNYNQFYDLNNFLYKNNAMYSNINASSPLSLYLTYIMYYATLNKYNEIIRDNNPDNGSEFYRSLLKYEYNVICWLMYFGEYWEGLKSKQDNNYKPKWKFDSIHKCVNSSLINNLISFNKNIFEESVIFNELPPCDWMKPLQFNENDTSMSYSLKTDIISKQNESDFYLYDWTMLRGSCPPNIQFKINKMYNDYRIKRVYQGRFDYASQEIHDRLSGASN